MRPGISAPTVGVDGRAIALVARPVGPGLDQLFDKRYRQGLVRDAKARVALSDGRRFGHAGRGFARINFATSRVLLTEILERMARAVAQRDSA